LAVIPAEEVTAMAGRKPETAEDQPSAMSILPDACKPG
jgi:hypothetical protein